MHRLRALKMFPKMGTSSTSSSPGRDDPTPNANRGYMQADLTVRLGSRARASEMLQTKRRFTLPMIWKLSREWKIPADALVAPYPPAGEVRRRTGSAKRKAA